MAIEELNVKLIYEFDGSENWKDEDDLWIPVCPTSAHSGKFTKPVKNKAKILFRRWYG